MKARASRPQHKQKKSQPVPPSPRRAEARSVLGGARGRMLLHGAGLGLLAFLVYIPALRAGFIWDDQALTENPCVKSLGGLWKIWFAPGQMPQEHHYWPLVYTTFWLEHLVAGMRPFLFHMDNILLHAAATVLLWRVLVRLGAPGAWLGAALFAVHPIHAESVAWVIERKDVLCGVFFFGAALAYLHFECGMRNAECGIKKTGIQKPESRIQNETARTTHSAQRTTHFAFQVRSPGETSRPHSAFYALALALFIAAMLSKSIAIGLPLVLGVVLWWRHGRLARRDLVALAPMAVIAAGLTIEDMIYFRQRVMGALEYAGMGILDRLLLAAGSLWVYLAKLAWPWNLATFYPKWTVNADSPVSWLPLLAWAGLFAGLWLGRRRIGRGPLAALAFYALMLAPVLGLVAHDFQVFSWVADRFQYLASAGPLVLAAAGLTLAGRRLAASLAGARFPGLQHALAGLLILFLAGLTCFQAARYRDSITLFRASIASQPRCWAAYNNLAFALAQAGRGGEAVQVLRDGLRAMPAPDYRMTLELAGRLADQEQFEEAEQYYRKTMQLKPDSAIGLIQYASFLASRDRLDDALAQYHEALRVCPDHTLALYNLGNLLRIQNKLAEAGRYLGRAVELDPAVAMFRITFALVLSEQGKQAPAAEQLRQALRLEPHNLEAHFSLAQILLIQERYQEAIPHLEVAARLEPQAPGTHLLLGRAYQALNNKSAAIRSYQETLRLQPDNAEAARNLQLLME